jgi:alkanesulfonate monooxygenase SsuD/methylene tetrahydromethanopterin reductase-like flavin-dependent oxidoreductase (luciferase family)
VTKNIALFSTVHVPMVHPVFAAKALATVDHASGGRSGLNIVCGWSPEEFGMFGLEPVAERYEQGLEWFEILSRIHADTGPFDYDGKYYKLKAVSGKPAPLQRPRPITLNAAFSPPGRDFAARAADFLFTSFTDIDKGRDQIADISARAEKTGRTVGVFTTCHVVCRPTQAEAEDYYDHYAVKMEDTVSANHYMGQKQKFSGSHEDDAYRLHRKRFVGGAGTYPLVGTPRHIADEMVRISQAGFAGTTVSFVNFTDELPYFIEGVLPLLREAGLRN